MIKVEDGEIILNGIAPKLFSELGYAACEIIKSTMTYDGITKESAIKMLYTALDFSIKFNESNGEL